MVHSNLKREYNTDKLISYNNPSFIKKMIELFIKSANDYSSKMDLAVNEKHILQINKLAHCIKPSIDLLNINSLNILIREVELAKDLNNELMEKINSITKKLKTVTIQMQEDYLKT